MEQDEKILFYKFLLEHLLVTVKQEKLLLILIKKICSTFYVNEEEEVFETHILLQVPDKLLHLQNLEILEKKKK